MGLEEKIIQTLKDNGYEADFVGGYPRDMLLGKPSKDKDIATDCPYDVMEKMLKHLGKISISGKTFGVLRVSDVEVAQYRTEVYDETENKHGKPKVAITRDRKSDASRRDFTINALYMDLDGNITDYFGGTSDLKRKLVKCVGSPYERFTEDASRIIRAVYLASKLGFDIEEGTKKAIYECRDWLKRVPKETIGINVEKVISSNCLSKFTILCKEVGILEYVFPAIAHLVDLPQNPHYHKYDAFNHTMEVLKSGEVRKPKNMGFLLGLLYHDNAKGLPEIRKTNPKNGQPQDLNHEEFGEPIAYKEVIKLGLGKEVAQEVAFYVRYHGSVRVNVKETNGKTVVPYKQIKNILTKLSVTAKNKEELGRNLEDLIECIYCDADGFNEELRNEVYAQLKLFQNNYELVLNDYNFYVQDLPVTANEVKNYLEGKEFADYFNYLITNNIQDKGMALNIAKKHYNKKHNIKESLAYNPSDRDIERFKVLAKKFEELSANPNQLIAKKVKLNFGNKQLQINVENKIVAIILQERVIIKVGKNKPQVFYVSSSYNLLNIFRSEELNTVLVSANTENNFAVKLFEMFADTVDLRTK